MKILNSKNILKYQYFSEIRRMLKIINFENFEIFKGSKIFKSWDLHEISNFLKPHKIWK
jgi:hypothetical protein